jgi:hypothetical protein
LRTGYHIGDLKVLKDQGGILVHQLARFLMQEVGSTVAGEAGELLLCPCTAMAPLLAPMQLPLRLLDALLRCSVDARVRDVFPSGKYRVGLEADINTRLFG